MSEEETERDVDDRPDRRGFLKKAGVGAAVGIGAAAGAPLLATLLTPLKGDIVKLEGRSIDAGPLAAFGPVPRKVVVRTTHIDAWTRAPEQIVGAVYVIRVGEQTPRAFSAICPHASCSVSFDGEARRFVCPCHQSVFETDGELTSGPGPRGLDPLPVTVRDGRVIVTYEQFRPGIADRQKV